MTCRPTTIRCTVTERVTLRVCAPQRVQPPALIGRAVCRGASSVTARGVCVRGARAVVAGASSVVARASGIYAGRAAIVGASSVVARAERIIKNAPLFIETIADFNNTGTATPAGLNSHPAIPAQAGNNELILSVTGTAGSAAITATGPIADGALISEYGWAAVIQHDDGSFGCYYVTDLDVVTGEGTVKPLLTADVTAGKLTSLHSSNLGQHYGPFGYQAFNTHILEYPAWKANRGKWIAQWPDSGIASAWGGTQPAGRKFEDRSLGLGPTLNGSVTYIGARSTKSMHVWPNAPGSTIEQTVDLLGKSGYVDSYISSHGVSCTQGALCEVIIDGTTVYSKSAFGLVRHAVQFENASSGTIRYTFPEGDNTISYRHLVGATTWWEAADDTPIGGIFDGGPRVVYLGDSWGEFYGGVGPKIIEDAITPEGGVMFNESVGGQTSQWALDNFNTLVLPHSPDIVVIEYFTNDRNQGMFNDGSYRANISALISRVRAIGARPVVVLPAPTASASQTQEHANMAAIMAEGVSL